MLFISQSIRCFDVQNMNISKEKKMHNYSKLKMALVWINAWMYKNSNFAQKSGNFFAENAAHLCDWLCEFTEISKNGSFIGRCLDIETQDLQLINLKASFRIKLMALKHNA